jgi:hypothetical protein
MRLTISLPDAIVKRLKACVPPQRRSGLVAKLLARELKKRESALESACAAANRDKRLEQEIDEWQALEDGWGS